MSIRTIRSLKAKDGSARLTLEERVWLESALKNRVLSKHAIARALGISSQTVFSHKKRLEKEGKLPLPDGVPDDGFSIVSRNVRFDKSGHYAGETVATKRESGPVFDLPSDHDIKGVSALVDQDGRVRSQWIKTRREALSPEALAELMKSAFDDFKSPHIASIEPDGCSHNLIALFPAGDWHLGLFTWGKETGENWDLKIAEQSIERAAADTIARTPKCGTFIFLIGGDYFHSDTQENRTTRSGHALDVDGRKHKIVQAGVRLAARVVDFALSRAENIIIRVLPGNHDEETSILFGLLLKAYYNADLRVTVDDTAGPHWFFRHGKVMLAATHGHALRAKDMPGMMANYRPDDWGATRWRYGHSFHIHHGEKMLNEHSGASVEIHRAPVPRDSWHYAMGYGAGRALTTIVYDKYSGEIARTVTAIQNQESLHDRSAKK